jgi:hypothetical protein
MAYVIKVTNQQGPWSDGEVPYVFGDGMEDLTEVFEACMTHWESFLKDDAQNLVKFVKKGANHKTFIRIKGVNAAQAQTSAGCIGSPEKKGVECVEFTFNTSRKNEPGSIPHELAHILGLAHEHQRNRAADIKAPQDASGARLYYLGAGKKVDPKADKKRRNSIEPKQKKDEKLEVVYSEVDQRECWATWDQLYTPVGDYDLKSITHYPNIENWKWNYNKFNAFRDEAVKVLNLPTVEQVTNSQWKPGPTDIDALKALYAKK